MCWSHTKSNSISSLRITYLLYNGHLNCYWLGGNMSDKPISPITWDEYFMAIARLSALRSKDPHTKVGACIVDKSHRILSIGYNGTPNGFDDGSFPWQRDGNPLDTKYLYVVHAERNAILNYKGNRHDFFGATLYVDLFPCNECAKEIIQSGIKEVVYLSDKYANTDETIASKRIMDRCGVSYRQFTPRDDVESVSVSLLP